MSEEKFTQGEWFFEGENEVNTEQKNICRCIRFAMEPGETEANAHLIAAAPEMYRFIKRLYDCGFLRRCDMEEAEELLKKARGEK